MVFYLTIVLFGLFLSTLLNEKITTMFYNIQYNTRDDNKDRVVYLYKYTDNDIHGSCNCLRNAFTSYPIHTLVL